MSLLNIFRPLYLLTWLFIGIVSVNSNEIVTRDNNDFSSLISHCSSRAHRNSLTASAISSPTYLSSYIGFAWDGLQNIPTYPVFDLRFSKCRVTEDGKYFIPDGVRATKIEQQRIQHVIDHHETFKSVLKAQQLGLAVGIDIPIDIPVIGRVSIGGSFSGGFMDIKKAMARLKTGLNSIKFTYEAYTLSAKNGEMLMSETFRHEIDKIGNALLYGRQKLADFLAQRLVRDYGSHVVTKAIIGASLERFIYDRLSNSANFSNYDWGLGGGIGGSAPLGPLAGTPIRASVSATLGGGYKSNSQEHAYDNDQTKLHDDVRVGKITLRRTVANGTGANIEYVVEEIAGLRYEVKKLSEVINWNVFSSNNSMLEPIRNTLDNAIVAYYKANLIRGCTDPKAINFMFEANEDDGSCKFASDLPIFGGLYAVANFSAHHYTTNSSNKSEMRQFKYERFKAFQNMIPYENLHTRNIVTSNLSCPKGFEETLVYAANYTYRLRKSDILKSYKVKRDLSDGDSIVFEAIGLYKIFACTRNSRLPVSYDENVVLFGGFYRLHPLNDANKKHNHGEIFCPKGYTSMRLMFTNTYLCLSRNYREREQNATQFAGMYSCASPLSQQNCPIGFEAKLLAADRDDCPIYICSKLSNANADLDPPKVKRPPYFSYDYHDF